jgi:hypothetical protein
VANIWAQPAQDAPPTIDPRVLTALAGAMPPVFAPAPRPDVAPAMSANVARGLGGDSGGAAPLPQVFSSNAPQVRMPTAIENATANQEGRLQKLVTDDQNPWGTPKNHPGFLGKLGHALNVATGGVNRRRDEEGELIRTLNGEEMQKQQAALLGAEAGHNTAETALEQEQTAEMPGKTKSEEALQGATAENLQSETEARKNPSLEIHDTDQGPLLINPKTGAAQHIDLNGQPVGPQLKLTQSQPIIGDDGKPHTYMLDQYGNKKVDLGVHYERPITVNAGQGEADRIATRLAKPYETGLTAGQTQLDKIDEAASMVGGNAEAQALGVPKAMTALVSGQGSGVRITQAELNMIGHARGIEGDVEGTLRRMSGQGALTPTQQQQLLGVLADAKRRISEKIVIQNEALDLINGATSREEAVTADKEARRKLQALESGGGAGPKTGDVVDGYRFKGGDAGDQKNWEQVKK